MERLPAELVESGRRGDIAWFVGAGASAGSGLPTWRGLVDQLRDELPEQPPFADLPTLARYYELEYGRRRLISVVSSSLQGGAPNSLHRSIAAINPRIVFTTNFDDLLEQALKEEGRPYRIIVADDEIPYASISSSQVYKLHGTIERPSSLIFTNRDYELYEDRHPGMARLLAAQLQTSTLIIVGYSASDPDFRTILSRIHEEGGQHARRLFMLSYSMLNIEKQELRSRGIEVIDLDRSDDDDPTLHAARWVDNLRNETIQFAALGESKNSTIIEDKSDRTVAITQEARHVAKAQTVNRAIIRMRQGYGPFGLGDLDHPDQPRYSALLAGERDAFIQVLKNGGEARLIVGRRPVFSSDLATATDDDYELAQRLRSRCERLIAFIQRETIESEHARLIVACSTASHFSDAAFDANILFRGVRSDSASGYSVTSVSRDRSVINKFCREFDTDFSRLAQIELQSWPSADVIREVNRRAIRLLRESLNVLDSWLAQNGQVL